MLHPQVLVYESESHMAQLLRREPRGDWLLREPRRVEACLRLLRRAAPSVLVVCLGGDLIEELTLVDQVGWLFPDTATVVVGGTMNQQLEDLAWDLGAAYVLFPPHSTGLLPRIVDSLMHSLPRLSRKTIEKGNDPS